MPYPVQDDDEFGKSYLRHNAWHVALAGGGFAATFIDLWRTMALGLWGWIGIAAFGLGIIQLALSERRRLKNYHCPACGQHLDGPMIRDLSNDAKQAYTYDCKDCQTTWDTKLRVPSD